FAGAALTATSISITARVLSELNSLATREGQIILGAAVADDVLGLIVLAVVTQVVRTGSINPGVVLRSTLLAFGFLAAALVLGIPAGRRPGRPRAPGHPPRGPPARPVRCPAG